MKEGLRLPERQSQYRRLNPKREALLVGVASTATAVDGAAVYKAFSSEQPSLGSAYILIGAMVAIMMMRRVKRIVRRVNALEEPGN